MTRRCGEHEPGETIPRNLDGNPTRIAFPYWHERSCVRRNGHDFPHRSPRGTEWGDGETAACPRCGDGFRDCLCGFMAQARERIRELEALLDQARRLANQWADARDKAEARVKELEAERERLPAKYKYTNHAKYELRGEDSG